MFYNAGWGSTAIYSSFILIEGHCLPFWSENGGNLYMHQRLTESNQSQHYKYEACWLVHTSRWLTDWCCTPRTHCGGFTEHNSPIKKNSARAALSRAQPEASPTSLPPSCERWDRPRRSSLWEWPLEEWAGWFLQEERAEWQLALLIASISEI